MSVSRNRRPASSSQVLCSAAGRPLWLVSAKSCEATRDVGRGFEFNVHALRTVLEEPGADLVVSVVAMDELEQLVMLDAAALDARERAGRLHAVVAHVPVAACVQRQPAVAGRHVRPLLQRGFDDVIHGGVVLPPA